MSLRKRTSVVGMDIRWTLSLTGHEYNTRRDRLERRLYGDARMEVTPELGRHKARSHNNSECDTAQNLKLITLIFAGL